MPNVRAALSWVIDAGRRDDALRLVAELRPLLGDSFAGRRGCAGPRRHSSRRATPRHRCGQRRSSRGPGCSGRAAETASASISSRRERGSPSQETTRGSRGALRISPSTERGTAMRPREWPSPSEAVEHANRSGDELAVSDALVSRVHGARDFATAARHAPAAIRQLRSVGNLEQNGGGVFHVGYRAIVGARYEEALQWLDQGLSASDESGKSEDEVSHLRQASTCVAVSREAGTGCGGVRRRVCELRRGRLRATRR